MSVHKCVHVLMQLFDDFSADFRAFDEGVFDVKMMSFSPKDICTNVVRVLYTLVGYFLGDGFRLKRA